MPASSPSHESSAIDLSFNDETVFRLAHATQQLTLVDVSRGRRTSPPEGPCGPIVISREDSNDQS